MPSLLSWFLEENPHRILIPRQKLLILMGLLFVLKCLILLLWNGIFIILALFLVFPLVYLLRFGLRVWRRYYAIFWYPVCLVLLAAVAVGVRVGVYHILS